MPIRARAYGATRHRGKAHGDTASRLLAKPKASCAGRSREAFRVLARAGPGLELPGTEPHTLDSSPDRSALHGSVRQEIDAAQSRSRPSGAQYATPSTREAFRERPSHRAAISGCNARGRIRPRLL